MIKKTNLKPENFIIQKGSNVLPSMLITNAVPKNISFMIHPLHEVGPVCVVFKNDRWHLISPEVAEKTRIDHTATADLYLGLMENGEQFVLVIVHPWRGYTDSWMLSAQKIVKMARRQWVRMQSNKEAKIYEMSLMEQEDYPKWSALGNEQSIIQAFDRRIVTLDTLDEFHNDGPRRISGRLHDQF